MVVKNIVLIISDTFRKDHISIYGNKAKTPNIDKFSKESIVFENAYPESLPTIPARRAIYTGIRAFPFKSYSPKKGIPWRTPGWEPIPEEHFSLSEVLKSAKYRTALISDNYHLFEPSMNFNSGFDEWIFIRGQEYDKYVSSRFEIDILKYMSSGIPQKVRNTVVEKLLRQYFANVRYRKSEEDWFAPRVFREGIRWLEENRDAEKFFLVLELFDPHEPWDPPHEFVDIYDPGYNGDEHITPIYGSSKYLSEKELRHMRAHYAGEVTLVDKWFGIFLNKIYELNLDKNTLIIFTSDHGHQLGEHGIVGKVAWGMYPELMDIPLIIRHPDEIGSGEKFHEYVQSHDIFTTILESAGIKVKWRVDGINILKYVEGRREEKRQYITCSLGNYLMYRDEEYWLIVNRKGGEAQLYYIKEDPMLKRNIANETLHVVRKLYEKILYDAGGIIPELKIRPEESIKWYTINE